MAAAFDSAIRSAMKSAPAAVDSSVLTKLLIGQRSHYGAPTAAWISSWTAQDPAVKLLCRTGELFDFLKKLSSTCWDVTANLSEFPVGGASSMAEMSRTSSLRPQKSSNGSTAARSVTAPPRL